MLTDRQALLCSCCLNYVACPEFQWGPATAEARPPPLSFLIDPFVTILMFLLTSLHTVKIVDVELSGFRLLFRDGRGRCVVALIIGTWIFGYINPNRWKRWFRGDVYTTHFAVALLRSILNTVFFFQAYADRPSQPTAYSTFTLAWLACFGYTSMIHLSAAYLRLVDSYTERKKRKTVSPFEMRQLSPEQRQREQAISRHKISENSCAPRDISWYQPRPEIAKWRSRHYMSTNLDPELAGDAVLSLSHSSLFSRCTCCVDRGNEVIARTRSTARPSWKGQRDLFLKLPPQSHSIYGAYPAGPIITSEQNLDNVSLHHLCPLCEKVCSNSELLEVQQRLLTYKQFWKYIPLAFRRKALMSEYFEHHESALELRASAMRGCHLCNMVWSSLSSDQQKSLLGEAASASRELNNAEGQRRRLDIPTLSSLRSGVRIYLKILSPSARGWMTKTRLYGENRSLYLIPHFGLNTVARRWMKERQVERAKSLDHDPTSEWWREHVEPIEIRATKLENQGPLYICPYTSTNSDGSIEFISTWLNRHRHSDPMLYSDENNMEILIQTLSRSKIELPRRLIDLSEWHNNGLQTVLTADLHAATIKYAALSYCWRKDETYKLLRKTRLGQMPGPLSMMPTVLRDAINITLKLGISYLWVDSLCIIQDDEEDQDAEMPRMSIVYSNAEFVVAAAASWDGSESFLVKQNPLQFNPCLVGVRGHITGLTGNAANSFGGIYALPPREFADEALRALDNSRFSSRGWIFQEEFLAQRVVYFGDEQVILRCNVCQTWTKQADWDATPSWSSKPFPDLVKPDIFGSFFGLLWHKIINFHESTWKEMKSIELKEIPFEWYQMAFVDRSPRERSMGTSTFTSIFDALQKSPATFHKDTWWSLVEAYSQRFLTKPFDKLRAMQGLALRAESDLKKHGLQTKKYVKGHWMGDDFTPSLLWYISDAKALRPAEDRAPSWSWASVDGRVKNTSLSADSSPDATGVTLLEDPWQSEGALCLRGRLKSATWRAVPHGRSRHYVGHRQLERSVILYSRDLTMFDPVRADPTSGPETFLLCDLQGRDVGYFLPDAEDIIPQDSNVARCDVGPCIVQCLRVVVHPPTQAEKENFFLPWATRGLVLVHVSGDEDIYKRVGFFELYRAESEIKLSDHLSMTGRKGVRARDPEIDNMHFFDQDYQEKNITII